MPLPIPAPRAEGTTTTTRHPLYWARYGPEGAPRIVVLHGGPGAHHDYLLPQLLELARDHELLLYDQRGGGRSKVDDAAPITFRSHLVDLRRVVDELAPGPLTILGYSWGGLLAMLYAIDAVRDTQVRHPARLLLVSPAPISRPLRDGFERTLAERGRDPRIAELRAELAASGLRARDPDAYRQRTFELAVAGYFADPRRATDLTPFRVSGRVQASTWESLGDFDLADDLQLVRCPAIVVHGREDPIPLRSSELAAAALGAELVVLEDCGHVPYVEAPDELFDALRRFLRATPAG